MMQESKKREQFRTLLLELAKNENLLEAESVSIDIYERLEDLYCPDEITEHFRHFYSDIFEVLSLVKLDSTMGSIEILGQNLCILYENYEPTAQNKDVSKELKKLYDHVSLDIARMSYADAGDYRISGKQTVQELQDKVDALTREIKEAHEKQEQLKKELANQQREYIAILGIFAAIVITFIGGLAFSTSVLNNIDKVSTVKLMLISLTIGLVLVHILFGLFLYLDRIVNSSYSYLKILMLLFSNAVIIALMFYIVHFLPYLKNIL